VYYCRSERIFNSMAIKKIVLLGEPKLRKISTNIQVEDISKPYVQDVMRDLGDTLLAYKTPRKKIQKGVGIAANQIGSNLRIFAIYIETKMHAYTDVNAMPLTFFINPKIISHGEEMLDGFEGCMSFKHYRARIRRYKDIEVEAYNEKGELMKMKLKSFQARVFQHEYDHLDGTVFIDKADTQTLVRESDYAKKWKKAKPEVIEDLRSHRY
jgi:peptide deformylase